MQPRRSRLGPPPSWTTIVKATASGSLISMIAAGAAASTPDPNSVVVMPGAVIAAMMLFRRRIRTWAIIVSAIVAAILSGPLWLIFNSAHAARWVLVADAAICPIAAIGVARLLVLIRPATMVPGPPTGEIVHTEPAQQPSTAMSPPSSDLAEPPLPADLIQ